MSSSGEVVTLVGPGQNIEVKLKDVIEENFSLGLVLCDSISPISTCRFFNGQVSFLIKMNKIVYNTNLNFR